jgi:hypothetical protein
MIRRRISTHDQTAVTYGEHDGGQMQPGKDAHGRFCRGNKFGRGNVYSREQARIQAAIRAQLTDEELEKFVKAWIAKAKAGKGVYLISLLERLAGRTADWATVERVDDLEATLEAQIINGTEEPEAK